MNQPQTPEQTNEVARLREENAGLRQWLNARYKALSEADDEVARLRELLKRAIVIADEFWKNQKQAITVWHGELADELEEIKKEAALAPSPEEPVIQDSRITEPVPLEPEKQLPAGYKGTRRWDEEPAPEWRELGPDEVIGADDEYNPASLGEWIKVPHGWIGEKCDTTIIRTRRPLPAPEEPVTQDGATMSEWYGGFSKIESTEPVIQENRITEPVSDDYMLGCDPNEEPISYEEPASEWRELGKDEVICEGDEYKVLGTWKRDSELKGMKVKHAGGTFRTRRPLPKQEEERPILKVMEYCRKWADEHLADHGKETFYSRLGLLVDFATDLYRDEIQKLQASVNKTTTNS